MTVVEYGPQLAGREDPDVADAIRQLFSDEGIEVLLSAESLRVEGRSGEGVRSTCGRPRASGSSKAATSWPRRDAPPIPRGLGWTPPACGWMNAATCRSTTASRRVPRTWAIGKCAGSPQFTHVSEDDFGVIRDNLAGGNRTTRDRLIPYCLFTDPPLARVGLSEAEARRRGVAVWSPSADGCRAADADDGGDAGFMKALVERERPHPGLHDVRPGGRGSHGRGADGDAGGHALHGLARCHPCTPDDGGRPEAVFADVQPSAAA